MTALPWFSREIPGDLTRDYVSGCDEARVNRAEAGCLAAQSLMVAVEQDMDDSTP